VDVSRVIVEITEHAAVPDYAALHRALGPHRDAGLRLAVDDAGAGYASFRHILNLRPDLIKVDSSLVSRIDLDAAQQALVRSLLTFAENSGAVLLAEGVETQGELDELARIGVPLVQGFLLARPSPPPLPARYRRPSEWAGLNPLRRRTVRPTASPGAAG
jgi:EAL domain-containing protein (putative c-di-GMP-specific phosphodiesterase class I)